MRRYLRYFGLLLLVLLCLASIEIAQAAVEISFFSAEPDLPNGVIRIYWATGSEYDFAGVYILRSLSPDTGFNRLKDQNGVDFWYPATGAGGPAQYMHVDTEVVIDTLYYYNLEIIDLKGDSTPYTVVSVYLGNTPTPTSTSTATSTATATVTPTSSTSTATGTRTPVPPTVTRTKTHQPTATLTRTATPFHAVTFTSRPRPTSTLTETPTTTPTPTISPTETTTLVPLPSLTLLFPVHTPTPTFTSTASPTVTRIPPTFTPTPKPGNQIPLRFSFLGGIIILLWLTLAGFLYTYLRRISR